MNYDQKERRYVSRRNFYKDVAKIIVFSKIAIIFKIIFKIVF